MENTEDRTDGSLTPVHTGSHGEHMPETVPLSVLSNFTLPHTQDEDGHPQRSSSHRTIIHMVTVTQGQCPISVIVTPDTRSQACT